MEVVAGRNKNTLVICLGEGVGGSKDLLRVRRGKSLQLSCEHGGEGACGLVPFFWGGGGSFEGEGGKESEMGSFTGSVFSVTGAEEIRIPLLKTATKTKGKSLRIMAVVCFAIGVFCLLRFGDYGRSSRSIVFSDEAALSRRRIDLQEGEDPLRVLYFGYGSNLRGTRLKLSTPSAEFVGLAELDKFCLAFTVPTTRWRGGAADVLPCNASVLGAVWSIKSSELPALDIQEAVDTKLYFRDEVVVTDLRTKQKLTTYVYRVVNPLEGLKPSVLYMRVIIAGAEHIHMPQWYIDKLKRIKTVPYDDESLFQMYNN